MIRNNFGVKQDYSLLNNTATSTSVKLPIFNFKSVPDPQAHKGFIILEEDPVTKDDFLHYGNGIVWKPIVNGPINKISTNNAIALWDGITGTMIKNSSAIIDDGGVLIINGIIDNGDLLVNGNTTLNGTLHVLGAVTFDSTLHVLGDVTFDSNLHVLGNELIDGTLEVVGATTLDNTLDVIGATTLNDTLHVIGATTLDNTLDVVGVVTFDNNLNVGGTLDVTGTTTLGNTLDVTGATTLNNTLHVVGVATFDNNLNVGGDLHVIGDEIIDGSLDIDGNLNLPITTSSTQGVITQKITGPPGVSQLLHTYGLNADNLFLGHASGNFTTTGVSNVGLGVLTLRNNSTGNHNTATGTAALVVNNTGSDNTANGNHSMFANTSGSQNAAFGGDSLLRNTTGSQNTAIGMAALDNCVGTGNIALGYLAGTNIITGNNNICIGNQGVTPNALGEIRIGTSGTHTSCFIQGINNVTFGSGASVLVQPDGQLGTLVSSQRFKHDIEPVSEELSSKLQDVNIVSFKYNTDPLEKTQYGVIAEQIQHIYPETIIYEEDGTTPYSVQYHLLWPLLIKEMQVLSKKVQSLTNEVQNLTNEVQSLKNSQLLPN